ncbi:uncharacterized protein LOC134245262 [Saccostrea cucullata]|uniref:uncharacterized protein LOC134245262 n=1 Tax=Saccostrea cuccullata TaxID=36930 RepID=UPI002ED20ABC
MSVLQKLSDEFGISTLDKSNDATVHVEADVHVIEDNFENSPTKKQPSCLGESSSSPAIKQPSCSGEPTNLRASFEERLVEKLLSAQSKQFHDMQEFVMAELNASNERLDELLSDEIDGEPPAKMKKVSEDSSGETAKTSENSILEKLSKQFDGKDKFGLPIGDELAKILKAMFTGDKTKANEEKKREENYEKFKLPQNCEILLVPKVNKEIWRSLPASARNSDLDIQKPQKLIANAMVPIIRVVDNLIKTDPHGDNAGTNETVNRLMEAISMIAMANDDINHVRRNCIKPSLNVEY